MPSLVTPINTESPMVDRSLRVKRQSFQRHYSKMKQQDKRDPNIAHSRSNNSKQTGHWHICNCHLLYNALEF